MSTRQCKRCSGEEFQLTNEDGDSFVWESKDGERSSWFCPNCDWSKPERTVPEL